MERASAPATERWSGPGASTRRPADGAINGGNGPLDASFVANAIVRPKTARRAKRSSAPVLTDGSATAVERSPS